MVDNRTLAALRRAQERALQRAETIADMVAAAEKIPAEDPYLDGTVIRYRRRFNDNDKWYSYAAARVGGVWWQSGQRTGGAVPWSQYVTWLVEGKIENIQVMEPGGWLIPDGPQPVFDGKPAKPREETVTVDREGLERFVAELLQRILDGDVPPELRKLVDRDRRREFLERLAQLPQEPPTQHSHRDSGYHPGPDKDGESANWAAGDPVSVLEGDDDPADSCSACGGYHEASYDCSRDDQAG